MAQACGVTAIVRALDTARRRVAEQRRSLGQELRRARLNANLSQVTVATLLGCSAATISRIEAGRSPLSLEVVARFAVIVGLELRANLFPLGSPLRDAGQLRVLRRLEPEVGPAWRWQLEVPVGPNDLRAFDAAALQPACRIGFDVWSRVRDLQAQARNSLRKQTDSRFERLILVLAETTANRAALHDAGDPLRRAFPLDTRTVLRALRAGRDPGANGIVLI
jgi:transcriptional regulator with XRE-family HTH domain